MSMTLEQFIQKARENEEKKVKITTMNIDLEKLNFKDLIQVYY